MSVEKQNVEGKVVEKSRTAERKRSDGRRERRRGPLNERDVLRVDGLSDEFVKRWEVEEQVPYRISEDWDIVTWDEIENVGDIRANSPNPNDSRVSIRSGGQTLILMKKYKDWKQEDDKAKNKLVDNTETGMKKSYGKQIQKDGTYGNVDIG